MCLLPFSAIEITFSLISSLESKDFSSTLLLFVCPLLLLTCPLLTWLEEFLLSDELSCFSNFATSSYATASFLSLNADLEKQKLFFGPSFI